MTVGSANLGLPPAVAGVSPSLAGTVGLGSGSLRVPRCPSAHPGLHSHSKWKSHGSLSCDTLTGGCPFTQWMLATGFRPSRATWLWPSHRATVQSDRVQDSFTWERAGVVLTGWDHETCPHGPAAASVPSFPEAELPRVLDAPGAVQPQPHVHSASQSCPCRGQRGYNDLRQGWAPRRFSDQAHSTRRRHTCRGGTMRSQP